MVGWVWLTRLKANRLVNPECQGVRPVAEVTTPTEGRLVHLKGYGLVRLFTIVAPNGDSEGWATNDLSMRPFTRTRFAGYAWTIEHYHRGLKQFCGVERAQRNHRGLALRAFLRLESHCYHRGLSWFEAKHAIIRNGRAGLFSISQVSTNINCVTPNEINKGNEIIMKPILIKLSVLLCIISVPLLAAASTLEDETARISYSLGYQIGGDFKRQQVDIDPELVVQGMQDALSDADPTMTPEEMRTVLMELERKVVANQMAASQEEAKKHRAQGQEFLQENADKEGVKTTASGLQYKVIKPGTGKSPGPSDTVTVNYRGTLIDGQEFDSSYKRNAPATFALNQVIAGWTEGLQLMKEGGKWQFFIPPELAYADRGPLAGHTLIFDVELLSVGGEDQAQTTQEPAGASGE